MVRPWTLTAASRSPKSRGLASRTLSRWQHLSSALPPTVASLWGMGFPLQVGGGHLPAQQRGLFDFLLFQGSQGSRVPRGALGASTLGALWKAVRRETLFPIGSGFGGRPIRALPQSSWGVPSAQPRGGGQRPGHALGGSLEEQQVEGGHGRSEALDRQEPWIRSWVRGLVCPWPAGVWGLSGWGQKTHTKETPNWILQGTTQEVNPPQRRCGEESG